MSEQDAEQILEDSYDDDEEDEDAQKDKYLTFHLGKEIYGIEIYYVMEIVGIQKITQVPDMPDFVKGVMNLRGQIIPLMDVRTRFRMTLRDYNDRTCVIVVRIEETLLGLIVDTVNDVANIPVENISPPPEIDKGISSRYIKGIGKIETEIKILLDVNRLLFENDQALLSDQSSESRTFWRT